MFKLPAMGRPAFAGALVLFLSFFSLGTSAAVTLDFFCITLNNTGDCAIGESQLSVDVSSYGIGTGVNGGDEVLFTFMATGPADLEISEVYFDDGTLLGIAGLIDADENGGNAGVDFEQGANPPDLPGGNSMFGTFGLPNFDVTAGFLADADNPAPQKGVSPGESLGVIFELQGGGDVNDILLELTNGDLRIGMHVIDYDSGGSESFVNNPIPIPAAAWLFGTALIGLAGLKRKK